MILSFLFFTFVAYLIFKLVFDFVIPIYKTTKQVKRKFRDMHEQMNGQENRGGSNSGTKPDSEKNQKKPSSDYIDFEEVKD